MKIIIDVCFLIDMKERKWIPKKIEEDFRYILKNFTNWSHCIIGGKMKKEFFNRKNYKFLEWYRQATSGEKSIRKDYNIKYGNEDRVFDECLNNFIINHDIYLKNFEKINEVKINDHHILFATYYKKINFIFSVDKKLEKIYKNDILLDLFQNNHSFIKFIGSNILKDEKYDLKVLKI